VEEKAGQLMAALRVHPTGKAQLGISVQTQGQGHETTFAQIVAEELGIPPEDVDVIHGDTDTTPHGLGTYGSRSTPVSGAATAIVARKVRDRARIVASAMLEGRARRFRLGKGPARPLVHQGRPEQGATIQEIAMAARGSVELPPGVEAGLNAETVYDPPNLTFPFGAYICAVDIDPGTAKVTIRRFVAVDDCGVRINPMIVEGQIHGGLTDGVGIDKGIGESATVGSPPTIVNAICDALRPHGVRHINMPCTPSRVWDAMHGRGGSAK
jgi:aerobic carbon-monoxide dehydrogenase large subunit